MKKILQKHSGKLMLLTIGILFLGTVVYANQAGTANNEGVILKDHVKGNPDAEVVLVKHGDFECPFCASAYPVVDQIIAEYGDHIRFEYKHLPLNQIHPQATPAAVAAEAAGQQGKFFAYHDALYDRQREWSRGNSVLVFRDIAEELELDMELFNQHRNAPMLKDKVQTETQEAIANGFRSTPTFTLNGEVIPYSGYESLQQQIEMVLNQSPTEEMNVEFGL